MSVVWVAVAILLGCLLVFRWTDLPAIQPAIPRLLLVCGAGAAGGIGLTSCLFFVFGVLAGSRYLAMGIELTLLAWTGYEVFRRPRPAGQSEPGARSPFGLAIGLLALLAVAIATSTMAAAWEANPQGNWDAWAIWNLRARFLASGAGLASRAWSPLLGAFTHPEYPLLLSGFVARCWAFSREISALGPEATSYLFFLSLVAIVAGGVSVLRGSVLGALAALVLVCSASLMREVPAQYADVPLACFMAGAVVFLLLNRPILAGAFAGFAAWTKDEGLLFLVLFAVLVAVSRRKQWARSIAGAAPVALLVIVFKWWLARGAGSLLSSSLPGAAHRLVDLSRYKLIVAAFWQAFAGLGLGWYHPLLAIAIVALALRFSRDRQREAAFAGLAASGMLAGYIAIYAITANDLNWQLQTSSSRLLIQTWPIMVVGLFTILASPPLAAATTITVGPNPKGKPRKRSRRVDESR